MQAQEDQLMYYGRISSDDAESSSSSSSSSSTTATATATATTTTGILFDTRNWKIRRRRNDDYEEGRGNSNNNNISNSTSTITNTNTNDHYFDTVVWPSLQERLCPDGLPDYETYGATLFDLAQNELLLLNVSSISTVLKTDHNRKAKGHHPQRKEQHEHEYDHEHEHENMTTTMSSSNRKKQEKFRKYWYNNLFTESNMYVHPNTLQRKTTLTTPQHKAPALRMSSFFFYPPLWKCANNAIHSYLTATVGMTHIIENPSTQKNAITTRTSTVAAHKENTNTNTNTNHPYKAPTNDKPCLFAVIRDPIQRFASGYNEIEYRTIQGIPDSPFLSLKNTKLLPPYTKLPLPFLLSNTTNNKTATTTTTTTATATVMRERRVQQFIYDLVFQQEGFPKATIYKHVAPMSTILHQLNDKNLLPPIQTQNQNTATTAQRNNTHSSRNRNNRHSSWIVPSGMNNLQVALPTFLQQQCPTAAAAAMTTTETETTMNRQLLPNMDPILGSHESSKDEFGTYQAAKKILLLHNNNNNNNNSTRSTGMGGTAGTRTTSGSNKEIKALCTLYAMDYACFSDLLPDGIPTYCKDVYATWV